MEKTKKKTTEQSDIDGNLLLVQIQNTKFGISTEYTQRSRDASWLCAV